MIVGAPAGPEPENGAIRELAKLGARFVAWKSVPDKAGGEPRKVPFGRDGKAAKTNDPATWLTYTEAVDLCRRRRMAGIGFVFNGDGLGGIDLDACRDPETGEIAPWAMELISKHRSYAEISPSGTGVKIISRADPMPKLVANKIVMGEPNTPGAKTPQIEVYSTQRYFTLTGQLLDGCPDEIADATEAWGQLAFRLRQDNACNADGTLNERRTVDPKLVPSPFSALLDSNETIRDAWEFGKKLGGGKDSTASGLEFSLAIHLAPHLNDADLEAVIRLFPHGQIGSGKLKGGNADRRIDKLLKAASKARERHNRSVDAVRWFALLDRGENGVPKDLLANVTTILREEPKFGGRFSWDEMRGSVVARGLPWSTSREWCEWTDLDDLRLAEWCQQRGVPVKPTTCAGAVQVIAAEKPRHDIREFLSSLIWDDTPRLDHWLANYLGAERTLYTAEVGRRFLISAVARIMQPGCKADHALILEGRQGAGKSSAARALAIRSAWFSDEISDLGSKDSAQDLRGKWLVELAELSAMRRSEIERVKAFISRSVDHYRPSYGRRSQDFPRQCVFIGSTNADAYLADETGGRRFWPVKVGRIDLEALQHDVGQLWAEAVAAFRAGEPWWLDRATEALARGEQEQRQIEDPWTGIVLEYAERRDLVVIGDVLSGPLEMKTDRQDQLAHKRVASILRAAGWTRGKQRRVDGKLHRPYLPPEVSPDRERGAATGDATGDGHRPARGLLFPPTVTPVTRVTPLSSRARGDYPPWQGGSGGGAPTTLAETRVRRVTGDTPPGYVEGEV